MTSLLECETAKFSLAGYMQLTCTVKSYFTLNAKLRMTKYYTISTLGPSRFHQSMFFSSTSVSILIMMLISYAFLPG